MTTARVRSCATKQMYISEREALRVMRKVWEQRQTELRVYQCRYCAGWHLTSKLEWK